MAYLVLKRAPDFRMERAEAGGAPVEDEIILDTEETKLSYDWIYFGLMGTVPVAVPIMVTVSALLLALGRRRAREV